MAFIGNGAQLTDLDAGDIASGTLPVARGGTGVTSVGTSGNVLTSNGSVWTSTAIPAPTIADGSITDAKISDTVTAGSVYIGLSNQIARSSGESPNFTSLTKFGEGFIFRGGTANFRLKMYNGNTGPNPETKTLSVRLYRSGVAIAPEQSISVPINAYSGFVNFSNISYASQGTMEVWCRGPSAAYILGFADFQIGVSSPLKINPIAELIATI